MFVIEKDMGKGNAPAFLTSFTDASIVWGTMDTAQKFATEQEAQDIIDKQSPLWHGNSIARG